jgi:DtxR family Mn-dependent transcriptional regulator
MRTKASSVTDMVKRMSEKGLINYEPYQGSSLTKNGKQHALKVIRKHRLWEYFLVDKLKFSWDEVHEIAEELEHIQSEKLTKRLDSFLGFPKVDPHGDPIPDEDGNFKPIAKTILAHCKIGGKGNFVGVKDSSPEFLQYLDRKDISLGDKIEVCQREEFDGSLELKINGKEIGVSSKTAENLYVEPFEN